MQVVATAGHVDHGKSTLLRTLTGMEPDRWTEERERGLTIDLGFVWTELSDDDHEPRTVAFVDVPGHEKFISNMLAGAGAVQLALFVVAADDGWSAQSQEHLDILDLLGVSAAVVAVTKASLAGEDRALDVAVDVEQRLAGTTLAGAPVVVTDSLDGTGIDELRSLMLRRLEAAERAADHRRVRLWVDRSFTIAGAGTVVTGTLEGGTLSVGEDVAILPSGRAARVRGLQSLGRAVEQARPGDRVAVNLTGVDRDDVGRGDALVTGGQPPEAAWVVTDRIDTRVRVLAAQDVDRPGAWHLHVGSAETTCSVHPLLGDPLTPEAEGYVRILLDHPLPLQTGDRFVLREAGRRATVAGGEVIDPRPPGRVRGIDRRLARTEQLDAIRERPVQATGDDEPGRLPAIVRAWGGIGALPDVKAAAAQRPDEALPAGVTRIGKALVDDTAMAGWSRAAVDAARRHHEAEPTSPGLTRDDLAHAIADAGGPRGDIADEIVDHLATSGVLRRHGSTYATPEHVPAVTEAREDRTEAFLAALGADPLAPPKLVEAAKEHGLNYQETQKLTQTGAIIRAGDIAFLPSAVAHAVDLLRKLEADVGPFTAAQAKDAWNTTRKYAIPLLEHLDRSGVTTFDGQHRRLRS